MKLITSCSALILLQLLLSCGGGSSSNEAETPTPAPTPTPTPAPTPTPIEISILGFHKLRSANGDTSRYLLLSDSKSYVWDVATQSPELKELMCKSSETPVNFTENLTTQTINFICTGGESENLNLVVSLNQEALSYEFNQPYWVGSILKEQLNINSALSNVILLNGSKISEKSGGFRTEVRDDLAISRYILASPRGKDYFSVMIMSRDWPIGGHCNMSRVYRQTPTTPDDYGNHQYILLSKTGGYNNPSWDCNRVVDILPIPLQSTLDSYFYGLDDGSFIGVFEQSDFMTIGQLIITE